ncbi:MmcQ/YjbR family DNA-binding protein [Nocardioides daphniae]|uniref:MmcQ/YjbR family DNA-binding protein n=1 Tax=Nocardioides daphniae TaxID=402297 RepID=A0A4P7UFX0_9ACTN|nr:MmcQ/YjbR family DNA-binding protein [Nocardioides daphniae]QCC78321.1 MmcQ/YjbR family DNA-binding protein [Nocardioides daphniae]GGD13592.1 hypothetical protein GCM10007231_10790 [Nocardioides daphniae]
MARKVQRPEVPTAYVARVGAVLNALPDVVEEPAWVGVRWRVHGNTVAHLFGGEDQLFRITFRGEPDEVSAFQHLGEPYFRSQWGDNVIGLLVDDGTDWEELAELLTDSYCLRAPAGLVALVERPAR